MSRLGPDAAHWFEVSGDQPVTHLRLDGGLRRRIARLRVHGTRFLLQEQPAGSMSEELSPQGGHSGQPLRNPEVILYPDKGLDMGDGWETRRRREPGFDWIIVALGQTGTLDSVLVDTAHYKGNFPATCSMNGRLLEGADLALLDNPDALKADSQFWPEILPSQPLSAMRSIASKPVS